MPQAQEVELDELEAVLGVEEEPGGAVEAARQEAAQRVVAAELLELPEGGVAARAEDESAVQGSIRQEGSCDPHHGGA